MGPVLEGERCCLTSQSSAVLHPSKVTSCTPSPGPAKPLSPDTLPLTFSPMSPQVRCHVLPISLPKEPLFCSFFFKFLFVWIFDATSFF